MFEPGLQSAKIKLSEIAHARSGDKGNHANVGVIAYSQAGFEYLGEILTAERVADYFAEMQPAKVERFELPGIYAYNFLLYEVLGGGASRSLRVDTQGKTLAIMLLEMRIPKPAGIDQMTRTASSFS